MSDYTNPSAKRPDVEVSADEVAVHADEAWRGAVADVGLEPAGTPHRDWLAAERARRAAARLAWETASLDVPGGPLEVGGWYDVEEQTWTRGKTRTWRVARYSGRGIIRYREGLLFAGYGVGGRAESPSRIDVEPARLVRVTRLGADDPAVIRAAATEKARKR